MKSREIYKRFKWKFNKNDTNDGVDILESIFVLNFNTEAENWLGETIRDDADNDKLDGIDGLLITNLELVPGNVIDNYKEFILPSNFYKHTSSYSLATKGDCESVKIYNFPKKPGNFTASMADAFSGPSFDMEETPFLISRGKLQVYFSDFTIEKCFASFYKKPEPIDIAGYTRIDGTPSIDLDNTDLSDQNIDEILDRLVITLASDNKDGETVQMGQLKVKNEA